MKIAVSAYPVSAHADWTSFADKLGRLAEQSRQGGAELLVLPEYFSMELATMFGPPVRAALDRQLEALQAWHRRFRELLIDLAKTHRLTIVGGSFPVRDADGRFRNRCTIVTADDREFTQDKRRMTRFENEQWRISAGQGASVIDLGACRLGVAICYDSEFPLLVRELVERGANLIAVPSCTDSVHGFHRVEIGCRARALENQCYVVQSPTVGALDGSLAIDENHGAAGVFAPPDRGFPADGVIAQSLLDQPALLFADLDFALIEQVRRDGQVLNHRDW